MIIAALVVALGVISVAGALANARGKGMWGTEKGTTICGKGMWG